MAVRLPKTRANDIAADPMLMLMLMVMMMMMLLLLLLVVPAPILIFRRAGVVAVEIS